MINCYHNGQHPYIATASRDDLTQHSDKKLRYPMVHAVLNSCEVLDEILGTKKHLLYIEFQSIVSSDNDEKIVEEVRSELLRFLSQEYRNNFYYFIDGEFCKVADMRDTMVGKYMLLPLKLKKI